MKHNASQKQQPVSQQLSSQRKAEQESRRMCLVKQLQSLAYLLRQGLAVRGHKSDEGNLQQLLKLRSLDVPALKQWISERKYFSADIIREQTSILGKCILREIATDIRNAYWFSLIADETSDVVNQEQFNISVRWVGENFIVHEDPVGVVAVPDTTGDTLFNVIENVLTRLNLPIRNCRGQAYDGASNMQGNIKGVATRVQEVEPSAIHVHCLAHCLNLCLQDVAKQCSLVRDALDIFNEILKLIKNSPKRSEVFKSIKAAECPDTPQLRKLCPTRWTMRTASIDSILKNYAALISALEEIYNGNDEHAGRAGGLKTSMEKFSTFFSLKLSHFLFAASEQLSLSLQSKDISAQEAFKAASLTKSYYHRQRNDESFDKFYLSVLQQSETRQNFPNSGKSQNVLMAVQKVMFIRHLKSITDEFFFEVIDCISGEIINRFDQPSFTFIQSVEEILIDAANGNDLCSHYRKVTNVDSITQALVESDNRAIRAMLSEVRKLLQLYLTVPVTSSTSERSFSALRQIKTYLRITMTQEKSNQSLLCYVHSNRTDAIDFLEAANEFASVNDKRIRYFGTFSS